MEIFSGNTSGPKAFTQIVTPVRKRFGITDVVFVGDRGMITAKRIKEGFRRKNGVEGISALHTDGIQSLVDAGKISRSHFDINDRAEVPDE